MKNHDQPGSDKASVVLSSARDPESQRQNLKMGTREDFSSRDAKEHKNALTIHYTLVSFFLFKSSLFPDFLASSSGYPGQDSSCLASPPRRSGF